jgi:hypothetical protein
MGEKRICKSCGRKKGEDSKYGRRVVNHELLKYLYKKGNV